MSILFNNLNTNVDRVSVYIPAYNAEKTISYAIESLLNQTLLPNEIIVINDSSLDKTLEIVNSYKDKVSLINNNVNKGLGYCRNLGIKHSKNKLVASIDSDVVPEINWLENLIKNMIKNQSVYCGGKLIEKNINQNVYNKWRSIHLVQNWGDQQFKNPPFVYGCNNILNKEIIKDIGGYDDNLKTNGEDVEFSKRIYEKRLPTFYDSTAICYHIQNDNLKSLSRRYWRHRTYGYKIKKFSYFKFIKITIKEFKMLLNRISKDIKVNKFDLLKLEVIIYIKFILYEFKATTRW